MGVNKVNFGNTTIMDITDTTATASDVASGKYFYGKDGVKTLGTASGGSSWKKLGETDITTSSTSTSNANIGSIACGSEAYTKSKIIYIRVRDKAGRKNGYFYGSDSFYINSNAGNDYNTTYSNAGRFIHKTNSNGNYEIYMNASTSSYGVYGYSISTAGNVLIYRRYSSSNSLTIDGTYHVEVYSLEYPDGKNPFDN